VLILGCGFTGSRVAHLMRERGFDVVCTSRSGAAGVAFDAAHPDALADLLMPETLVLHSIPVGGIADALRKKPPARVVYLSTTGVYGDAKVVNETTPPAPDGQRFQEEQAVLAGPWSALVLRPAAIYGPGRGIHASMRAGKYRLVEDGANFVSRIHADDLAAHAAAALLSDLTGAYPVADEAPCTSREIAEFCAKLLAMPVPRSASREEVSVTSRADRRVDGSAIRRALGLQLQYPSYLEGVPACLEAEARALAIS
jgi:nucleoside-diphosphate-sugar epimerase